TLLISATSGFSNCSIPLLAANGQAITPIVSQPLVANEASDNSHEAIRYWSSVGLTQKQRVQLQTITLSVVDLPPGVLGYAYPDHIEVDATAAGYGWFIDPTPADNVEFERVITPTELQAGPLSPAYGRMDLLTVIMHEYGHVLGLDDLPSTQYPNVLMADQLP